MNVERIEEKGEMKREVVDYLKRMEEKERGVKEEGEGEDSKKWREIKISWVVYRETA